MVQLPGEGKLQRPGLLQRPQTPRNPVFDRVQVWSVGKFPLQSVSARCTRNLVLFRMRVHYLTANFGRRAAISPSQSLCSAVIRVLGGTPFRCLSPRPCNVCRTIKLRMRMAGGSCCRLALYSSFPSLRMAMACHHGMRTVQSVMWQLDLSCDAHWYMTALTC